MFGAHISQLAHFEVTPPDLAASVAFYRDVLGMEVSAQKPGSGCAAGAKVSTTRCN